MKRGISKLKGSSMYSAHWLNNRPSQRYIVIKYYYIEVKKQATIFQKEKTRCYINDQG